MTTSLQVCQNSSMHALQKEIDRTVPMPSNPDGHTRVMGYQVNQHACRAVRDFLDARLRGRKDSLRHLTAAIQEVPGAKYSHVSASYSTLK